MNLFENFDFQFCHVILKESFFEPFEESESTHDDKISLFRTMFDMNSLTTSSIASLEYLRITQDYFTNCMLTAF